MQIRQKIEIFHLLFLRQLEEKLDKKLYALKGGCNLRFFFKSIRYSEGIDFDITIIAKATLENKINKILSSDIFKRILASKHIQIAQVNPAKQTETTQRWKILLQTEDTTMLIPTKIEFSRSKLDTGVNYAAVDKDIINQYQLYPIICNQYDKNTAIMQKIDALIHRTETQARDIFDLKWLFDQKPTPQKFSFTKQKLQTAIENANIITYADYKGQVVTYLSDTFQAYYDSRERWHEIITSVTETLQGAMNATD